MFGNIEQAIADLRAAIGVGQSCHIEADIAELIKREFTIDARIARAVRQHERRAHLRQWKKMQTVEQLKAA